MKRTATSLGHAFSGIVHALKTETNLRRFLIAHVFVLALGIWLQMSIFELIFIGIFGAGFVIIELLNTALERLADTFDDCEKKHRGGHYHPGIKLTKDVAAAAAFVALMIDAAILCLVFVPRLLPLFGAGS